MKNKKQEKKSCTSNSGRKGFNLSVSDKGVITAIYDDRLQFLIKEAKEYIIKRVSHVEPADEGRGGWVATMDDGTKLGPFDTRQEALDAEVKYLEKRLFGMPGALEASQRFLYCREYDNKKGE